MIFRSDYARFVCLLLHFSHEFSVYYYTFYGDFYSVRTIISIHSRLYRNANMRTTKNTQTLNTNFL